MNMDWNGLVTVLDCRDDVLNVVLAAVAWVHVSGWSRIRQAQTSPDPAAAAVLPHTIVKLYI